MLTLLVPRGKKWHVLEVRVGHVYASLDGNQPALVEAAKQGEQNDSRGVTVQVEVLTVWLQNAEGVSVAANEASEASELPAVEEHVELERVSGEGLTSVAYWDVFVPCGGVVGHTFPALPAT